VEREFDGVVRVLCSREQFKQTRQRVLDLIGRSSMDLALVLYW